MKSRSRAVIALSVAIVGAACGVWLTRAGAARPRVLLIGVDGADPAILERLIGQGRLPTFGRLRRDGAFGRLQSREPLLSPVLWTTIATGRKAEDHGVLDFVEAGPDGSAEPITSSRRRVPALWNIATQFGRTSGFIGWYASFPVERVRGFEISDRLAFHQVASQQATDGATFPSELAARLQERFGAPPADVASVRARFVSAGARLGPDGERRLAQLARIYATTEYYRRIVGWLQRQYRPELVGVYFEAIDACSHLFMEDAPPRRPQITAEDYAAFSQTVDRCYEYQDEVLADLLALADDRTLTIICSDHGFKSGDRRPETPGRADEGLAPLWHLPNGVVIMHGASVRRGTTPTGATILDIAPTVLEALGLPLARDLPGHPIAEAFAERRPMRERDRIAKYEFVPVPRRPSRPADSAVKLDELRALGYFSPATGSKRPTADGRFAASFLNEGVALYTSGEYKDALRAFARAVELDPANVNARAFAARIHLERRDFDGAGPLLDQALALDPRSVYVRLLRANLAISTKRWPVAEAELQAAAALDDRLPMLHLQRARFLDARGDPAGALDALATAEALTEADPLLLDVLVLRADAATRLGRMEDVAAALERAAKLAPADRIAAARAEVALARDDAPAALTFLRSATAENPRSARLFTLLGATYGRQGDFEHAIDAYERAVALQPTALACKTLAALLFEIRHDRTRAVALWEQSLQLDRDQPDVQRFLNQYRPSSPPADPAR